MRLPLAGLAVLHLTLLGCPNSNPPDADPSQANLDCRSPAAPPAGDGPWLALGAGYSELCLLSDGDAVPVVQGGQGASMIVLGVRARGPFTADDPRELHIDCPGLASGAAFATFVALPDGAFQYAGVTMPLETGHPPAEADCKATLELPDGGILEATRRIRILRDL